MTPKVRRNEYSVAREWAKRRNFNKYQLMGIRAQLRNMNGANTLLTPIEQERVSEIVLELLSVLRAWKDNNMLSRTLYETNKRGK